MEKFKACIRLERTNMELFHFQDNPIFGRDCSKTSRIYIEADLVEFEMECEQRIWHGGFKISLSKYKEQ